MFNSIINIISIKSGEMNVSKYYKNIKYNYSFHIIYTMLKIKKLKKQNEYQ